MDGTNKQGWPYLPYSCRYVLMAYYHLQKWLKRQGKANIHNWNTFWFRETSRYPALRNQARRMAIPKCGQNPFDVINKHGPLLVY